MKRELSKGYDYTPLSKHPSGSLKELLYLSFPLTLIFLSTSLLIFCDRYFLSHFSLESWKACSAVTPLCSFFQIIFMVMGGIAQSFVGRFKGQDKERLIGPYIWQMIWFSFLTMGLTYPISRIATFYIRGSEIEAQGIQYFQLLMLGNFLFPLAAGLSSFFSGRGKVKTLLLSVVMTHILNVFLDILLIYGVKGMIPPLGIAGAAIATLLSQLTFCLILFVIFMKKQNIATYCTHLWQVNWTYMWQVLKKGIPYSIGRGMGICCWLFASFIMINKGADHLLTLSFVTTLYLAFTFIHEGLTQTLVTIVSHAIGCKKEFLTSKIFLSALVILSCHLIISLIPLVIFRDVLISIFIKDTLATASKTLLYNCCLLIWFALLTSGFYRIALSFIIASKDTLFFSFVTPIMWVIFYLPVLIGIGYLRWSPSSFLVIESINYFILGVIFLLRFGKKFWKKSHTLILANN